MTPRVRLAAVPQAFNAEKVSGLTVTNTTGTLTIPNTRTLSIAHNFTTSGANPLTLTTTGTTNATIPLGTVTLADLASSQIFTNKTWQGNSVGAVYGGTGQTSYATGDFIYASAANTLAKRTIGTPGQCLTVASGVPTWANCTLQAAYDMGPAVNVADADIEFDLTLDGGLDTNFLITIASGSAGQFNVSTASGQFYVADGTVTSTMPFTVSTINTSSGNLTLQPAGTGTTANVQIGAGGAGSATPDLLVLDRKSSADDPTYVDGALYYNSATDRMRCAQKGFWQNCVGVGFSFLRTFEQWQKVGLSATTLTAIGGGTITVTGTAAAVTNTDSDFISYTAAAGAGQQAGVRGNTSGRQWASWRPRFSAMIRTGANIADQRIWVALSSVTLTADVPAVGQRQIGFRYSTTAGDTTWKCLSSDAAGTSAASDTGITVAANTTYLLYLDWTDSGTLDCIAQDLAGNTGTASVTANLDSAGTTQLIPDVRITNTTATAKAFLISAVWFDHR